MSRASSAAQTRILRQLLRRRLLRRNMDFTTLNPSMQVCRPSCHRRHGHPRWVHWTVVKTSAARRSCRGRRPLCLRPPSTHQARSPPCPTKDLLQQPSSRPRRRCPSSHWVHRARMLPMLPGGRRSRCAILERLRLSSTASCRTRATLA